jgi:uncharacterized membrane protein
MTLKWPIIGTIIAIVLAIFFVQQDVKVLAAMAGVGVGWCAHWAYSVRKANRILANRPRAKVGGGL